MVQSDCLLEREGLPEPWEWIDSPRVPSPDGKWVAYTRHEEQSGLVQVLVESSETGQSTVIDSWNFAPAGSPVWSPASTRLAYPIKALSQPGGGDIGIVNRDGSSYTSVEGGYRGYYDRLVWSPDGRYIAYASGGGVGSGGSEYVFLPYTVYVIDTIDGSQRAVAEGCFPEWVGG